MFLLIINHQQHNKTYQEMMENHAHLRHSYLIYHL